MTQQYIGTKQIEAWPQGKDGQPGYAVKYSDGYISWSPKDVFEAAYLPMGHVGHLAPHQQRVIGEKVELDDKLTKLTAFLETDRFKGLDKAEQDRMHTQGNAMARYSMVLGERIAAFGGDQ